MNIEKDQLRVQELCELYSISRLCMLLGDPSVMSRAFLLKVKATCQENWEKKLENHKWY